MQLESSAEKYNIFLLSYLLEALCYLSLYFDYDFFL